METNIVIIGGIDSNNHLNNAEWLLHLETGQVETAAFYGIGINMPVRQIRIKYREQILKGDSIRILTFVTEGLDFINFDQEIMRRNEVVGKGLSRYSNTLLEIEKPLQNPISEIPLEIPADAKALHPVTVLRSFEHARAEILLERGINMQKEREEQGLKYVVASLEVNYAGAVFPGQRVLVRTAFRAYPPQLIFQQEMTRNGQVVIKADTHCALIDKDNNLIRSSQIINAIKTKLSSPLHSGF